MSAIKPPCPRCGHVHTKADARWSGFGYPDPTYRAVTGGPRRATRAEAIQDACDARSKAGLR